MYWRRIRLHKTAVNVSGKCWQRCMHVRPVVCLSDASCFSGMLSADANSCRISVVTSISPHGLGCIHYDMIYYWYLVQYRLFLRPVHTCSRNRRLCIRKQAILLQSCLFSDTVSRFGNKCGQAFRGKTGRVERSRSLVWSLVGLQAQALVIQLPSNIWWKL